MTLRRHSAPHKATILGILPTVSGRGGRVPPGSLVKRPPISRRASAVKRLVRVASSLALLRGRPFHADALGSIPTSYLPSGRLVDSLDAGVYHPSAHCAVRRGDDFPVAGLVRETIANLKLHGKDLGGSWCCWCTLLLGPRSSHLR